MNKKVSRAIGVLYKLRPFVTSKIVTNVYYAIIYPFLLYGIVVWGNAGKTLLTPLHVMQKKFVRMATCNDSTPTSGPLSHTPPLFFKLKILNIFDIYKLQLAKLVHESINIIGPAHRLIKFNLASDVHCHETRFAKHGNFHVSSVRTTRFGLKGLQIEGAKLWENLPNNIKDIKGKKYFNIWSIPMNIKSIIDKVIITKFIMIKLC